MIYSRVSSLNVIGHSLTLRLCVKFLFSLKTLKNNYTYWWDSIIRVIIFSFDFIFSIRYRQSTVRTSSSGLDNLRFRVLKKENITGKRHNTTQMSVHTSPTLLVANNNSNSLFYKYLCNQVLFGIVFWNYVYE